MELVHGVPITEFCDANKLTPRQRLELFVPVCQAIQHAHQKGIIHRDVKPSNVLVTMYDDKPVPKVIDFGVAKAIEQRLTEKSVYTQFGTLVGTFEYMSPEQAEMNAFGVDTRSDIYALGVLLYELLTGTTPLERLRLREVAFDEIRRMIKEEEPQLPSVRLSTSGTLAKVAAARKTDPAKLSRLVRGELDWVVMKCLEKNRTQRYESASSLARDVEHYLHDEPVEARPPSAWYRFRKLARRNKMALTTAALVAGSLLLGMAASAWQAVRATAAEHEAWLNAAIAGDQKREADHARDRAEKQRDELAALNDRLHRLNYVADMNVARHAWEESNLGLARELLERHRPALGEADLRGFEWRYLRRLSHRERLLVEAHAGFVTTVAFMPDGKRLISLGMVRAETASLATWRVPGEIKGWDAATGNPFPVRLQHATDEVRGGALSPDGKLFAAGCVDKTVRVWNLETCELIATLQGHGAELVNRVTFSPDGKRLATLAQPYFDRLVVLQRSCDIRIWDMNTLKAVVSIDNLPFGASRPVFSPDGKRLAAGVGPKALKVWDADSGRELLVKDQGTTIGAVAFSPNGKRLAVATWSKDVRILDADTGELVKTCVGDISIRSRVMFTPDGKRLAAAGYDGLIELWNAESGQHMRTFKGHVGGVFSIALSPDATRLASAGADGSVRVWDITGDSEIVRIDLGKTKFPAILLSPDGRIALTGAGEEAVQLWDTVSGKRLGDPLMHKNKVINGAFTADGALWAATGEDKNVTIWDVTTRKVVMKFQLDGGARLTAYALSSGGNRFAFPGPAGVVKVWDAAQGRELRTLDGLKEHASTLEFNPEGTRLAACDANGTVKIWDVATGREICTTDLKGLRAFYLRFSSDGKRLAVAGGNSSVGHVGEVRILDAESGRETSPRLNGHFSYINPRFSPEGKRLATASFDGTVKVWDLATGQETLTLKGHTSTVTGLAFSSDGHRLISASSDGTVRMWNATPLPDDR
jgi:WD40 repeat protein